MTFNSFWRMTIVATIAMCGATPVAAAEPSHVEPDIPAQRHEVWDSLANCESGGNWSINSGNGYYGGLQFNRKTWVAYGGDQFSKYPHRASREQQISVAAAVRAATGDYGSWPACARKLGLPR